MLTPIVKLAILIFKGFPYFERVYLYLFPKEIVGTWCTCWHCHQDSDTYQIGSVEIKQVSNRIYGSFFSGATKWNLRGTIKDGVISAQYERDKEILGHMKLQYASSGMNKNKLVGKWTGQIYQTASPESQIIKDVHDFSGLSIFLARKEASTWGCHRKRFGPKEGHCTK